MSQEQTPEAIVNMVSLHLRELIHDVNNALFVAKGFLEELSEDTQSRRYMDPAFDHENFGDMVSTINRNIEKIPYPMIPDVIKSVDRGESQEGIVPIENSNEGAVPLTLDVLTFESESKIISEITIPIKHFLIVKQLAYPQNAKVICLEWNFHSVKQKLELVVDFVKFQT
jgi:prephenate dehydratase